MIPGVVAQRRLPYVSDYTPTSYLLPVPRTADVGSFTTGGTSVAVNAAASWQSTDYVVFHVTVNDTTTISATGGLTKIAEHQHPSSTTLRVAVFGGFKGSATSFTFSWTGTRLAVALGQAITNINTSTPVHSVSFSSPTWQSSPTADIVSPRVNVDSDGLFGMVACIVDKNIARNWMPGSSLAQKGFFADNGAGVVRMIRHAFFPIAEGVDAVVPPRSACSTASTWAIGCTVLLNRAAGTRPAPTLNTAGLDSYLSAFSAGYAWAVQKDGRIVASNAAGYARKTTESMNPGIAFTLDTRMTVASVSKLVTEIAVRQLVTAGLINLDAALSSYLTGYTFGVNTGSVTVRQLLEMTAGISGTFGLLDAFPASLQTWLNNNAVDVGRRLRYENGCIAALHAVVDAVTGSYVNYCKQHIFRPLGLSGIASTPNNSTGPRMYAENAALSGVDQYTIQAVGAGGWCMSVNEMLKLARALRRPVLLTGTQLSAGLDDRYRFSQTFSARAENHFHDGVLTNGAGRGCNAVLMRSCDGYDVVAMTNTERAAGTELIAACRQVVGNI